MRNKNEKTQIFMNKPVYLGLSILELSRILIFGFWYDYKKQNYATWIQTVSLYT